MIHLFQPQVGAAELAAIGGVFDRRWIGHGPETTAFEAEFATHLGVAADQVQFVASGTAALFLAVEALDLAPGDEVVLPSVSFVAAANAVVAAGGRPVFCDVDRATLNPGVADVAGALTERTKAVIVLHYGGYPGDVAAIAQLCRERGTILIEDAACAVGSTVDGRVVGTFGDLAIWSFDAMKIMTTGDGGMLYVRDRDRAERTRRLAYHGLAKLSGLAGAGSMRQWWILDVLEAGRRVIGNDMTAAMGRVQLAKLDQLIGRRREIAAAYDRELAGLEGVRTPPPLPAGHTSSHYFYWVRLPAGARDQVAADLLAADIYTTFRYEPLHTVPLYGFTGKLPNATALATETLCLPLHPGLSDADVHTVVAELRKSVDAHREHAA